MSHSMTSAELLSPWCAGGARALRFFCCTATALLLCGCGPARVQVTGEFPAPLIDPLPLDIGLWYDEAFANHEFSDEGTSRRDSSWVVRTGEAQTKMWPTLFGGMFQSFAVVPNRPSVEQPAPVGDAVIIPQVLELQYAIPAHTKVKVYEIWMRYQFDLVTPTGEPIADWTMTSYGKTPTAFLQSDTDAVNQAAVMALRDAGANFVSQFSKLPVLQQWLQEKGVREPREAP